MTADFLLLLLVAAGGVALAVGVVIHEHRLDAEMRASQVRLDLRFPAGLSVKAAEAALGGLAGLGGSIEIVFESAGNHGSVTHAVFVPAASQEAAIVALKAAIPSLRVTPGKDPAPHRALVVVGIRVGHPAVLRTDAIETATAQLLGSLTGLREGETVAVRWALRPSAAPEASTPGVEESSRRLHRDWLAKSALPGFQAAGLVVVGAADAARAADLAERVVGVIRGRARRRGQLLIRRLRQRTTAMPKVSLRSGWLNLPEVTSLLGWPLGGVAVMGLEIGAAREIPAPAHLSRAGRRLFIARDTAGERVVALTPDAARHHMAVVGASGSGKSVLLCRGIIDDLSAGFGGVLLDPKGDLLEEVLERVPEEHADRVVVLDPASTGAVPGLDLMGSGDADLRSDVLVGALSAIFRDNWGQRSDFYGRLGVRTLADMPGATLADFGRLFFEPAFRRAAIGRLSDPWLVGSWQSYEALSPGEQAQHVQAPMAKVMGLISRPAVRRVLAQPTPKLDVGRLLEQRKWLLVTLAPGTVGEPAARLIGAVVLYVVWSAIEARVALPQSQRRPLFVYVDELASLSALPFGFELLAERARGLGAGLVVAAQTLGRLPESTRAALLGNVATLISFRAAHDEAVRLSREIPGLSADDLQGLGRFEVGARVGAGIGSAVASVTGRTEPPLEKTGQEQRIRDLSAERYGVDAAEIDAALVGRFDAARTADGTEPLGRTGRQA